MKLILKGIILLTIILSGVSIGSVGFPSTKTIKHNPIYNQIVRNNPNIDKTYAMRLSNAIYYVAKLYNIDSKKYTAILAQESLYQLRAINSRSKDYGIAQINHKTAKVYGFDIQRLTTDVEYSVDAGAIVLADIKKSYGHKEREFWTRYNSSKPEKREKYKKLVARFM